MGILEIYKQEPDTCGSKLSKLLVSPPKDNDCLSLSGLHPLKAPFCFSLSSKTLLGVAKEARCFVSVPPSLRFCFHLGASFGVEERAQGFHDLSTFIFV